MKEPIEYRLNCLRDIRDNFPNELLEHSVYSLAKKKRK